jgi:hypothetical protein
VPTYLGYLESYEDMFLIYIDTSKSAKLKIFRIETDAGINTGREVKYYNRDEPYHQQFERGDDIIMYIYGGMIFAQRSST